MQLSVVIVSFNARHFLELCVQSVLQATKNLKSEIIIVDNNSVDGTQEYITSRYPHIQFLAQHENLGFSKANNIGVKHAKGEFICILNPDTVVPENVFHYLFKIIEGDDKIGIVGCKLIDGSGKYLPESKRNSISVTEALKKIAGLPSTYYAEEIKANENGYVSVMVGAFMFLRRELYVSAKGFDEDYFMYGEDFDFSYKIEQLQKFNLYCGELSVIHFKGESTSGDLKYTKHFYNAMNIFYAKHHKPNRLFSAIATGMFKLLPYFKTPKKETSFNRDYKIQVVSQKELEEVRRIFPEVAKVVPITFQASKNTTYVFDCDSVKFIDMIDVIESNQGKEDVQFLFWPSATNYFVGSCNSQSKGIVLEANALNY